MFDLTVYGFSPAQHRQSLPGRGGDGSPCGGMAEQSTAAAADRIDTLVAHERQIARLQAEQAEVVAAHAAQIPPAGGLRGAAAEVALARGVSAMAAEHQLHTSQVLVADLPRLLDLLHRGEISWAGASAVVRETGVTTAEVRQDIDRRLAASVERGAARRISFFTGSTSETDPLAADPLAADPLGTDPLGTDPLGTDNQGPGEVQPATIAEVVRGVPQLTVLPEVRRHRPHCGHLPWDPLAEGDRRRCGAVDHDGPPHPPRRPGPVRPPRPRGPGHPHECSAAPSDPRPVDAGVAAWLRRPIDWSIRDLDTGRRFFDGDLRTFLFARAAPAGCRSAPHGSPTATTSRLAPTVAAPPRLTARDCPGAAIICATWPGGS